MKTEERFTLTQREIDQTVKNTMLEVAGRYRTEAGRSSDLGGSLMLYGIAEAFEREARNVLADTNTIPQLTDELMDRFEKAHRDAEQDKKPWWRRSGRVSHRRRWWRRADSGHADVTEEVRGGETVADLERISGSTSDVLVGASRVVGGASVVTVEENASRVEAGSVHGTGSTDHALNGDM